MAWCTNCSTNHSPMSTTSRPTNSASKTTLPSAISLGSTFVSSSSKPPKEPSGLTCTARIHATSVLAIASARERTAVKPKSPTTCAKHGRSFSRTVKTANGFDAEDLLSITPIETSRSAKSRNSGAARFIKAVRRRGTEVGRTGHRHLAVRDRHERDERPKRGSHRYARVCRSSLAGRRMWCE